MISRAEIMDSLRGVCLNPILCTGPSLPTVPCATCAPCALLRRLRQGEPLRGTFSLPVSKFKQEQCADGRGRPQGYRFSDDDWFRVNRRLVIALFEKIQRHIYSAERT